MQVQIWDSVIESETGTCEDWVTEKSLVLVLKPSPVSFFYMTAGQLFLVTWSSGSGKDHYACR